MCIRDSGRAEEVGVIDIDRRHDGDIAVRHVGRIPTATHPHLDDRHIDGRVGEDGVGEHDEDLEERHPGATLGSRTRVDLSLIHI